MNVAAVDAHDTPRRAKVIADQDALATPRLAGQAVGRRENDPRRDDGPRAPRRLEKDCARPLSVRGERAADQGARGVRHAQADEQRRRRSDQCSGSAAGANALAGNRSAPRVPVLSLARPCPERRHDRVRTAFRW